MSMRWHSTKTRQLLNTESRGCSTFCFVFLIIEALTLSAFSLYILTVGDRSVSIKQRNQYKNAQEIIVNIRQQITCSFALAGC